VVDYFSKKYETKTKISIIEVGDNKSLVIKMYSYKHNIEVTFYIGIENNSIGVENNEWGYTI
jgi:ABC-type thiamine transport system substrate-binding protein